MGDCGWFLEWDNEMLDLHSVMVNYFRILHSLLYVVCFLATDQPSGRQVLRMGRIYTDYL